MVYRGRRLDGWMAGPAKHPAIQSPAPQHHASHSRSLRSSRSVRRTNPGNHLERWRRARRSYTALSWLVEAGEKPVQSNEEGMPRKDS